jgi:hypothetical protein
MTPQEKAEELVERYTNMAFNFNSYSYDKRCALIAVDEILDVDCCDMSEEYFDMHIEYWQQVKTEIENL